MRIIEVLEASRLIYGRSGGPGGSHKGKVSRKFRCQGGPRKGRIVANPSTCYAPIKATAKKTMTITRARKPKMSAFKSKLTKKGSSVSRAVKNLNKPRKIKN